MTMKIVINISFALSIGTLSIALMALLPHESKLDSATVPHSTPTPVSQCKNDDLNVQVDIKFHANHPELKGRSIKPGEKALEQEWMTIRGQIKKCPTSKSSNRK